MCNVLCARSQICYHTHLVVNYIVKPVLSDKKIVTFINKILKKASHQMFQDHECDRETLYTNSNNRQIELFFAESAYVLMKSFMIKDNTA